MVAEAAVDIAAAFQVAVPVAGDGVEGNGPKVVIDGQRAIIGFQPLKVQAVGADLAPVEPGGWGEALQRVAAGPEEVGAEHAGAAVEIAQLAGHAHGQRIGGGEADLRAEGDVVIAFKIVLARFRNVVDPVAALLKQARQADVDTFADPGFQRAFGVDRIVAAVADAREAASAAGTNGIELDDARRSVAAEQGALRSAQHLDAREVKYRKALQNRVFQHDIVVQDADRLAGIEIEVGIAETADVEARECAAERAFDVKAGHSTGESANVGPARVDRGQRVVGDHADADRHVLQAFLTTGGGDRDGAKPLVLGRGLRCGIGIGGRLSKGGGGGKRRQANGGKQDGAAHRDPSSRNNGSAPRPPRCSDAPKQQSP